MTSIVYTTFINEVPFTRNGLFERFLKWQRVNNSHVVVQDEDLQRTLLRLDARESRHPIGSRSRGPIRDGEDDDTKKISQVTSDWQGHQSVEEGAM